MSRKRIAIACQGGGSQCAFIAGALDALFEQGIEQRYDIVGLSGTSGGAITAALAWMALLERGRGATTSVGARIVAFWKDLSAQTPQELLLDKICTDLVRLVEHGLLPSVAVSPSSPAFELWSRTTSLLISRPEFTDLRTLLGKHLDFDALPRLMQPDSPVLLVGAGDVLQGNFKVFSSVNHEIRMEALLASSALPNLFPAVWVDGHAYWDGIFATNPPIVSFLQTVFMGDHADPEEIWIIQVNRAQHESVPEMPSEISDRRNHLAGNISLQHELQIIEMLNTLFEEGVLTERFRARFGVDATQPVTVRFIRMSQALQAGLDYPSKLSRQPSHIERLMADGKEQADLFLAKIGDGAHPPEARVEGGLVEPVDDTGSMWPL